MPVRDRVDRAPAGDRRSEPPAVVAVQAGVAVARRTRRSVLLPAPGRPMIRTTSPSAGRRRRRHGVSSRRRTHRAGWGSARRARARSSSVKSECRCARDRLRGLDCAWRPATGTMSGERSISHASAISNARRVVRGRHAGEHADRRSVVAPPLRCRRAAGRPAAECRGRCSSSTTPLRDVVVLPDAQLHLHRGDLGDAPGLLDLSDGHVAEADRLDEPVALQRVERADARRERSSRIGRVQLVEVNALDAERAPAGLARGASGGARGHPAPSRLRAASGRPWSRPESRDRRRPRSQWRAQSAARCGRCRCRPGSTRRRCREA